MYWHAKKEFELVRSEGDSIIINIIKRNYYAKEKLIKREFRLFVKKPYWRRNYQNNIIVLENET